MKLCIKASQFPDHIGNLLHVCQGFAPEQLIDIQIDKHRQRRSLDANAYCWVLLDKLAAVLRKPKTEIYRELIREVGGNSETVCCVEKAVDKLVHGGTQEAAADAAGVPVYALAEITQAEIDEVRADLKEMGWLD